MKHSGGAVAVGLLAMSGASALAQEPAQESASEPLEVPPAIQEAVTQEYGDVADNAGTRAIDERATIYFAEWHTEEGDMWVEVAEDGSISNQHLSECRHADASPEAERSIDGEMDDRLMPANPDHPDGRVPDEDAVPDDSLIDDVSPTPPSLDGVLDDLRMPSDLQASQQQQYLQQAWQEFQSSENPDRPQPHPVLWDGLGPREQTPPPNQGPYESR